MDRIPKTYQKFAERHPEVLAAYDALNEQVKSGDALSEEECALIKLAISIGAGMDGAMASQTRKAYKSGIAPEKLEQVAVLALPTLGLPRMMQAFKTIRGVVERFEVGEEPKA
ncbi:carboxymuconolactone decarboxylase family protein [Acanthopleuribacter pedis]|uniref:Carboxymuconolactone decarboxylase family protein n=1 Tax=Acanthopleuribacter pedis TaxID=442870 RepID=A0A8J7Q8W6_9BACT|nr:carboxymuconolactone decarboxylase family protein [Acanthopleuribacter pedis]MBO1319084.1 carboxymuconolactone decarboxylase family protein [Acanthopleuribacter pedis]